MKILILCDNFIQVSKYIKFSDKYLMYDYLICNNKNENNLKFLLRHLFYIIKSKNIFAFIKLFLLNKIKYSFVNLSHNKNEQYIVKNDYDIGVHSMGVIYRKNIIESFKLGILNSHIGILPKYRGRSVMEWSILNNDDTGITVFFIDSGIDTGKDIILKQTFNIEKFGNITDAKQYLFNQDVYMYDIAINKIKEENNYILNNINDGKRYYAMSSLLSSSINQYLDTK